ncbi:MAG: Maf-like protein [Bacillota bacterium]|nr:Maf-like protein [Bacillota bacterium]
MKFVLASASIRRQELLKKIINNFEVIVSDFNENKIDFNGNVGDYVKELSMGKAMEVANKLKNQSDSDRLIIIAADTVVAVDDKVIGKPKDAEDAIKTLKLLNGRYHYVYTGFSLIEMPQLKKIQDFACTEVKFSELNDNEIEEYVKSGEPMDKAGSYGIQGKGGLFVEKINGCYYNIVGLPLNKIFYALKWMGVNLTEE